MDDYIIEDLIPVVQEMEVSTSADYDAISSQMDQEIAHLEEILDFCIAKHTMRRNQCPACSVRLKDRASYCRHLRTHLPSERKFVCSVPNCSRSFSTLTLLGKHSKIHGRRNTFKCKTCPSTYNSMQSLKKHERFHDGSKRYNCSQCSKGFTISEAYKIHVRNHDGVKPFKCSVCQKSYASKAVYKRHKNMQHGGVPEDDNKINEIILEELSHFAIHDIRINVDERYENQVVIGSGPDFNHI